MTVVLALQCADGLVVACDSQITDPGRGLSYPAQKLHSLGTHAAWGGSGSRAVLYDIEQIFDAEPEAIIEAPDIGRALQQRVLPLLQHHYDTFIGDVPGDKPGATPATYVLAAGYAGDRPFIIDID
ncbi:MAG: proteasome protein, partial [Mycobacterium sp.]